jgi:hypothetical protein
MSVNKPTIRDPRISTARAVEARRYFLHELFARTRTYIEQHRSDISIERIHRSSRSGVLSSQKS